MNIYLININIYLINKNKMEFPTKCSETSNIHQKLLKECVEYLFKLGHYSYCEYINKKRYETLNVDVICTSYEKTQQLIILYYDHIYGVNTPFTPSFTKLFSEFDKLIIKLKSITEKDKDDIKKITFVEYNMWTCNQFLI